MKKPLLVALVLGSSLSHAIPTAFGNPKCGDKPKIVNNTNSDVMVDSEDCNQFYVKPPMSGVTKFTSFNPGANLNFCQSMQSLTDNIKTLTETRHLISKQLASNFKKIEKLEDTVAKLNKDYIKIVDTQDFKDIKLLEREIEDLDLKIDELITKYATCENNCHLINSEIREFKYRRNLKKKDLFNLKKANYYLVKESERLEAEIAANNQQIDDILELINSKNKIIADLEKIVEDKYKFYGALEGGFANINYDTGWEQNVESLRAENPGMEFRPIMTKNARLHVGLVNGSDEQNYLNSLPMILGYSIGGMAFLPFGDQSQVGELTSLPSKIGGSIRMSLVGACPIYYKDYLKTDDLVVNEDIKTSPSFAISATYDYPSAFKFKVAAKYNLYKFYERIEKTSSRGGFFSRKKYHSLIENRVDKDTFTIDWKVEDPDFNLDQETRMNITKALKEDLIQRVANMAMSPVAPSMLSLNAPTMPAQAGVTIFANGLKDLCWGASYWCNGGVYVLRGLGAIFGRTSANSYYRSTWDRTAEEVWSSEMATWKSGATAFPVE